MRSLLLFLLVLSIFLTFSAGKVSSNEKTAGTVTFKKMDYTVKVCIDTKCYLITYDNDGYIINVIADDE